MTSMMPNGTETPTTASASSSGDASPTEGTAADAQEKISQVASEVPAQASKVAHDVKAQLRATTEQTLGDVRSQADDQTARAAQGLRGLSTRAQALADGRTAEAGNLGGIVENVAGQVGDFAQRLENGGVQGLLDDASRFGRKRPIAFLALAGGAGFLAGRLARTGVAATGSDDASGYSNDLETSELPPANTGRAVVERQYTQARV